MTPTRREDWDLWAANHTWLPRAAVHAGNPPPRSWCGFWTGGVTALLESARGGRWHFLCDRPSRLYLGGPESTRCQALDVAGNVTAETVLPGPPLAVLEQAAAARTGPRLEGWPGFTGGWVTALSYEAAATWEKLPAAPRDDLELPLLAALECDEVMVLDTQSDTLGLVVWTDRPAGWENLSETDRAEHLDRLWEKAGSRLHHLHGRWKHGAAQDVAAEQQLADRSVSAPAGGVTDTLDAGTFAANARHVLERIGAGDTYQVNLSTRRSRPLRAAPELVYEELRRLNPSPYMGLLRFPGWTLVCGSPELLVSLENNRLATRPIAGTRPRGQGEADRALSAELLASPKERAEHLMLVDLLRNDLGRAASFGSVSVSEFMTLEYYSHVMHIVSQVEAVLAPGKSWRDALQSLFPGGTITGCPKVSTMGIIAELEPVRRHFYTGSLGWLNPAGDMTFNIVIRTLLAKDGLAHVQAGAGVVADSLPGREHEESLSKARALWAAVDRAEARTAR